MNWEQVEGQWRQLKGKAKSALAKVTGNDVQNLTGKKDVVMGKIQERYGDVKDSADERIDRAVDGVLPSVAEEGGPNAAER